MRRRSAAKLFAVFAALALVPVLVLGFVLGGQSRGEAQRRGLAEGRAEADVLARVAAEALLDGTPLTRQLSAGEQHRLRAFADEEVARGAVLRLRVRGLDGRVLFANDDAGVTSGVDPAVTEALGGHGTSMVRRLNTDAGDVGPAGPLVVESYAPVNDYAGTFIGVLEVYLPYEPIEQEMRAGLHKLYVDLGLGHALLYLVLASLAGWITRRLGRAADAYEHLAMHDPLTGLPNRTLFHERVNASLDAATNGGPGCAIVLIDLDRFKEVNDTLGHHNGDLLLVALANRLRAVARRGDTVARLGGDEFALVLADVRTRDDVRGQLTRLRTAIDAEIELAGLPLALEASIGVALAPGDGVDADLLLQRADVAMYVAKRGHAGIVFYDSAHDHYNAERLALVGELRRAIERGELRLHYQPKTALHSRAYAVEALMRWEHPTRGLLPPDEFIPVAEQTGLIEPLTEWLLDTALAQLVAWDGIAPEMTMAVNISARSLQRMEFPLVVTNALRRAGVPAHRLLLEVTETALITDPVRASLVLRDLASLGVTLSLDDFGSGYTNLGQLRNLPVTELKIDKSFVLAMTRSASDAAIVRSVIELGHNLGMTVVAEGVETLETLEAVTALRCDVAQGFWFSKPRPAPQMLEWLEEHCVAAALAEAGPAGPQL
ncbi:MAG: diguanylate cyclase [Actinomycetota bacterium]|nr:diguanylate cyclase [Actinomycetota bacterium]